MINRLKDRGIKIISITEPAFNMESEFSDITYEFNVDSVRNKLENARDTSKSILESGINYAC